LNFTFDGIAQAQSSIQRVNDFLIRVREIENGNTANFDVSPRIDKARRDFESAMDQDLNTSAALAAMFELIRDLNPKLDEKQIGPVGKNQILGLFKNINQIFDVFQVEEEIADEEITNLIEERYTARKHKDFQKADEIRDRLLELGIVLEDTREGTRWKRST